MKYLFLLQEDQNEILKQLMILMKLQVKRPMILVLFIYHPCIISKFVIYYSSFILQFYPKERILELATIAQKNYENPEYDHSTEKWLTNDEEEELSRLLQEGFDKWKKGEYSLFVQGCMEYGSEEYEKIAELIQTKTVEEVKEYAAVFWKKGR